MTVYFLDAPLAIPGASECGTKRFQDTTGAKWASITMGRLPACGVICFLQVIHQGDLAYICAGNSPADLSELRQEGL